VDAIWSCFLGEFGWFTKRGERVSEGMVDDMKTNKMRGMVRLLIDEVKRKVTWGWQKKFGLE